MRFIALSRNDAYALSGLSVTGLSNVTGRCPVLVSVALSGLFIRFVFLVGRGFELMLIPLWD